MSSDIRSCQPHYPPVSSGAVSSTIHNYLQTSGAVSPTTHKYLEMPGAVSPTTNKYLQMPGAVSPTTNQYFQMSDMSAPLHTSIFRRQRCQSHYQSVSSQVTESSTSTQQKPKISHITNFCTAKLCSCISLTCQFCFFD